MKFGGTSVGSPERLAQVLRIIASHRPQGPLVIVVSAMQHTTDHLIEAAHQAANGDIASSERTVDAIADLTISNAMWVLRDIETRTDPGRAAFPVTPVVREVLQPLRQVLTGVSLLRECTPQTLDLILSFGERLSAIVLSGLLNARGVPSRFVDSRDFIVTDERFGAARVLEAESLERLRAMALLDAGDIPVVTGFLGGTLDGRTTTLGRNGSDYTATLLAHWLQAAEVVIWTDVPGVMTADPAIVQDAYPLARLSYTEALELVDFGASMFHPRTMIPLIESRIPMRIRNTMHPEDPGTLVDAVGSADRAAATCVTSLEDLALLGVAVRRVAKRASVGGRVLKALEEAGLTVWLATQSAHGQAVAVVIPRAEVGPARTAIHEALALELERGEVEPVTVREPVTLLTLVAEAMGQSVGGTGRFFQALGNVGIAVRAIGQGASSRSISCVVDAEDTAVAVRTVHAAFNFAHQPVSLLIVGRGNVGGALLRQVRDQRERLLADHDVRVDVVGVVWRGGAVFDERGVNVEPLLDRAAAGRAEPAGPPDLQALLSRMRRLPVPILVDCTAADGMETLYEAAFSHGVHVVSANKKPLAVRMEVRDRLMQAARRSHRAYQYETTVGAGLPIIETLKDLVKTGDRVRLIEGSFSGSLGYVANELMRGVPLSEAVARARDLGFTEPNPLEDLSGGDVARKALILARELGLAVEFEDLHVEPFVTVAAQSRAAADEVLLALRALDAETAAQVEAQKAAGRVLRYLARIDPAGPAVTIGPLFVESDHLSTRLRGTEAFVAFTTERYRDYPLLVQGAGAGGDVTAAGVLTDILKVARMLRGG